MACPRLKFYIIPYLALGFSLSSVIGIQYYCGEFDHTPQFYGSPFLFKEKSLGSSLTYYYSISGVFLNTLVWSILLAITRWLILRPIEARPRLIWLKKLYKAIIIFLIGFSSLSIAISYMMLGRGFEARRNYWYINMENQEDMCIEKYHSHWSLFENERKK